MDQLIQARELVKQALALIQEVKPSEEAYDALSTNMYECAHTATGDPVELLGAVVEALGFADATIRDWELEGEAQP